jgi:hypothetical protein
MDAIGLDQESFLQTHGGPLWEDEDMLTCDWCEETIDENELPHVLHDPKHPATLVTVCDECALPIIVDTLNRHPPRDHAEGMAREALQRIVQSSTAGNRKPK